MSSKKIIVVFGATGAAGGSVAKYLLEDGEFAVRAVTRSASSDKAKALKAAGAEVVEADLEKPDTLPAALKGAYGVSALTDFWAVFPAVGYDADKAQAGEEKQGRALVDAAKAAGIKHFVYFSLPTGNVPHFEGKAVVARYLAASGVPFTEFINAFYYENVANPAFGMFKKTDDGELVLSISIPADVYVPSYSVDQSGGWVLQAFKHPETWLGKQLFAIGEYVTPRQYGEILSAELGKPVKVASPTPEEFEAAAKSDNPFVKEMYLNFKYFNDHAQPQKSVYPGVEPSRAIYPGQHDFATFVKQNPGFKKFAASLKA